MPSAIARASQKAPPSRFKVSTPPTTANATITAIAKIPNTAVLFRAGLSPARRVSEESHDPNADTGNYQRQQPQPDDDRRNRGDSVTNCTGNRAQEGEDRMGKPADQAEKDNRSNCPADRVGLLAFVPL